MNDKLSAFLLDFNENFEHDLKLDENFQLKDYLTRSSEILQCSDHDTIKLALSIFYKCAMVSKTIPKNITSCDLNHIIKDFAMNAISIFYDNRIKFQYLPDTNNIYLYNIIDRFDEIANKLIELDKENKERFFIYKDIMVVYCGKIFISVV